MIEFECSQEIAETVLRTMCNRINDLEELWKGACEDREEVLQEMEKMADILGMAPSHVMPGKLAETLEQFMNMYKEHFVELPKKKAKK